MGYAKKNLTSDNIRIIDLLNFKLLKYLPKYGFLEVDCHILLFFSFQFLNYTKYLKG